MARLLPPRPVLLVGMLAALTQAPSVRGQSSAFSVVEASIDQMRLAMEQGRTTSRDIVTQSLLRSRPATKIRLTTAITNQPARAGRSRRARSRRRQAGLLAAPRHSSRSKDNIHTTDIATTGGALAFSTSSRPYEATLTKNLREARRGHHRQDGHDRAGKLGRRSHADQLQLLAGFAASTCTIDDATP